MPDSTHSRRRFLKYAGAAVAAGAVAAAGYGISQYSGQPGPTAPSQPVPASGGKRKVKVGGTKPLTGTAALSGLDEERGLKLWAKWVNEAGGIRGGDGNLYEVELMTYNDESKLENVTRLYEKLINEDKVDFLMGPVSGPLGQATVAAVEKYRKLEFYGTATFDPALWKNWRYIIHVCTNGSNYFNTISDMIVKLCLPKDPDAGKIAIIHGDDIFANIAGTYGYEAVKKKKELTVVCYEKYASPPSDLTPVLTRVKAAQPSVLLVGGGAETTLLAKQCKEIDLDLKLLFPGTYAVYKDFYDALGKYAEDIISITQWAPGIVYPVNYGPGHDQFVSAFRKEYSTDPQYPGAVGFTQGLVLQAAMEKAKDPLSSDSVREAVKTVEFTGFYGHFKIDPETGWQIGHELDVIQWQNGESKCVFPTEAANSTLRYPMKRWSEK